MGVEVYRKLSPASVTSHEDRVGVWSGLSETHTHAKCLDGAEMEEHSHTFSTSSQPFNRTSAPTVFIHPAGQHRHRSTGKHLKKQFRRHGNVHNSHPDLQLGIFKNLNAIHTCKIPVKLNSLFINSHRCCRRV